MWGPAAWLAAFLLLPGGAAIATPEPDNAFIDYDKLVEAVFPENQMLRKFSRPTGRELTQANAMRDGVLRLIETAGTAWLGTLTAPSAPTSGQARAVMDSLKRTPIWLCNESCTCPEASPLGCAHYKQYGETVGAVIVLHSCLFGRGSCKGLGLPDKSSNSQLFNGMRLALTQIAGAKVLGGKEREVVSRAVKKAQTVLNNSSVMLFRMMEACPNGPLPESGAAFLTSSGYLKELNPFVEACAESMLVPLRADKFTGDCKILVDAARWQSVVKRGLLWQTPPARRCEGLCEQLTCAPKAGTPEPRLIQFGTKWMISIPEGACDGRVPRKGRAFVEGILRRVARPEILARSNGEAFLKGCAKQLVPNADVMDSSVSLAPTDGSAGGVQPVQVPAYDGPDVQLVE
jgi:hypothetical protein